MNRFLILAVAGLSLMPIQSKAAGPAHARLYCQSIKFQRGNDQNGLYSLDFTTINNGVRYLRVMCPPSGPKDRAVNATVTMAWVLRI